MSQNCTLVATAFNEAARIERCLDRLASEPLPPGLSWREFIVLAGASSDGTPDLARSWAASHPAIPVRVKTTVERLGKAADLAQCHAELLATRPREEIVCCVDADVLPVAGAPGALLGRMATDPHLDVLWGVDLPDSRIAGRRASAFQLEVTYELSKRAGDQPRAWGRFWAYRLGALAAFTWRPGLVVDDTQVSWYATERGLRVGTETGALVLTTPAKGYRDFYLQTYRAFEAQTLRPDHVPGSTRGTTGVQVKALAQATAKDPVGAVAYGAARLITAVMHRRSSHIFKDEWATPTSTKQAPLA